MTPDVRLYFPIYHRACQVLYLIEQTQPLARDKKRPKDADFKTNTGVNVREHVHVLQHLSAPLLYRSFQEVDYSRAVTFALGENTKGNETVKPSRKINIRIPKERDNAVTFSIFKLQILF